MPEEAVDGDDVEGHDGDAGEDLVEVAIFGGGGDVGAESGGGEVRRRSTSYISLKLFGTRSTVPALKHGLVTWERKYDMCRRWSPNSPCR